MSEVIQTAIETLNTRMKGGFDATVKFVLEDEGTIMVDENGAREGDEPADMTMSAAPQVFQDILNGDLDPAAAFMSGRLKVEGDMGLAMRLGSLLG